MRKFSFFIVFLLFLSSLVVTECISEPSPQPTTAPTPDTGQYGGTVVFLLYEMSVNNLGSSIFAAASHAFLVHPCREGLIDVDSNGNYLQRLAKSWNIDTKAKTDTFSLRQRVKFHDGTSFKEK